MTYHTEQCELVNRELSIQRSFYLFNFSKYCKACKGAGQFVETYDPSPFGVSLSSGYMVDSEPCLECTAQGICPRCGQTGLTNEDEGRGIDTGDGPCTFCGWDYHLGGVPELPECFCYIDEKVFQGFELYGDDLTAVF